MLYSGSSGNILGTQPREEEEKSTAEERSFKSRRSLGTLSIATNIQEGIGFSLGSMTSEGNSVQSIRSQKIRKNIFKRNK